MANDVLFHAPMVETNDEMKNMYLNFHVGSELYGIEIRYVLQIIGMQEITEMPEMPPYMKGFINMRGNMIPVVSMRFRFGKEEISYTERTCIIVVQVGQKQIGLIVDAIQETITIDPENIAPAPSSDDNEGNHYVKGIAKLTKKDVSILVDLFKLFNGGVFI